MTENTFVEAWYFGTSETEVKPCFDLVESRWEIVTNVVDSTRSNLVTCETGALSRLFCDRGVNEYIANVETLSISIFAKQSKSVFIRWKVTGRRRRRRRLVVDRHRDPTGPRNSSDSPLLRGKRRLEIRPDGTAKNFIKIVFGIVEISRLC